MMMKSHRLPAVCSAVTVVAFGLICLSTGPVRLAAALMLLGAFVGASWLLQRAQFATLGPAVGLALVGLILVGLALAAASSLTTIAVAAAIGVLTVAIAWASTVPASTVSASTMSASTVPASTAHPADAATRTRLTRPSPLAVAGLVIFATATACSVVYSAASATSDSDRASSLALWAYPTGNRLDVGVWQPADHGWASLRIVVTQAGTTIAAWRDIRLAPGQTWEARPITLTGDGPTQVVVFRGGSVVASLSG
jgi:hypothetical protein